MRVLLSCRRRQLLSVQEVRSRGVVQCRSRMYCCAGLSTSSLMHHNLHSTAPLCVQLCFPLLSFVFCFAASFHSFFLQISGAANTLGASSSSSSSQPAALICSAMLHLTSTAAVLTTLIAARQLVASQATEIPHGLQAPSMNQGPAESEALLAAPAAGTGPSTSFAEELVPAALDPSFVPVSSTWQLLHKTDNVTTCMPAVRALHIV